MTVTVWNPGDDRFATFLAGLAPEADRAFAGWAA
jgi:hypothetical protein